MIRVFVGYDKVESIAYYTLEHSIYESTPEPVEVIPIRLDQLSMLTRERDPLQSNDFSFSRWLVPYLCDFEGWSIFMDCDILCRTSIRELWDLQDEKYAVMCVKHDHRPTEKEKYLGNVQTKYKKKNWSSVMMFNNTQCKILTPGYVNTAHGLDLHQFKWLGDDKRIGSLPKEWNHLVGYDPENPNAKLAHFTIGGPYFQEYANCEFADEWFAMSNRMMNCNQRR